MPIFFYHEHWVNTDTKEYQVDVILKANDSQASWFFEGPRMENLVLVVETATREPLVHLRDILPKMANEPATRHMPFVKDGLDGSSTLNASPENGTPLRFQTYYSFSADTLTHLLIKESVKLRQELHQVKDLLRLEKTKTRKVKKEGAPEGSLPLSSEEEYNRFSKILHKAKNNALQRFQDVLAYFENCNDSLNHEQAKSEQLEHELEKSHQACRDLRSSKEEIEVAHDKLKKDFEVLLLECNSVKGELIKTSKIYEELQSTHEKSLTATYSSHIVDDTCTSNSTSFEVSTLKENVELRAQLDLLTSNYGKLEENHVMLTSSHANLLTSHNVQKLAHEAIITKVTSSEPHVDNGTTSSQSTIFPCASPRNSSTHNVATSCDELLSLPCCSNIEAYTSSSTCVDTNHAEEIEELKAQVTSLKKDLEQCHEGMSTPNNVLCEQTSPNDKNDVGVNSNKNKSGLEQVKNSAKIICFKCKVKGHHVRSCPLKTKSQSHKQQGKRPQTQSHTQLQVEGRPLPNKTQANTPRGTLEKHCHLDLFSEEDGAGHEEIRVKTGLGYFYAIPMLFR
ncbi:hypothetical protein D1007_59908 [Hordeum vulgare]|nr:hypothetical protein D1007_59908 [Hordeum vulgare]